MVWSGTSRSTDISQRATGSARALFINIAAKELSMHWAGL